MGLRTIVLSLCYRQASVGSERLSNFLKVTQLVNSGARIVSMSETVKRKYLEHIGQTKG